MNWKLIFTFMAGVAATVGFLAALSTLDFQPDR